MDIRNATNQAEWDDFLSRQDWRPFLQSWTMGEVYGDIGQTPVRIIARNENGVLAICFGHIVNAKRGKHLSVPYGPVFSNTLSDTDRGVALGMLVKKLTDIARDAGCVFIRMSPFIKEDQSKTFRSDLTSAKITSLASPLHLLAEHVWYLPLQTETGAPRNEDEILMQMRKTTRNLVRRAERDGVTIERSTNPDDDLHHFIKLHDETRKRHSFTPYSNDFFRSQVKRFAARNECSIYLARYQGEVIAASIHMHAYGETSYHHGASSSAHHKIPASYLLQWTAIRNALKRYDTIYNFWGIAPPSSSNPSPTGGGAAKDASQSKHPFGGVTLFKTGFGGEVFNLMHCIDIPIRATYAITYVFEKIRKWKRGF